MKLVIADEKHISQLDLDSSILEKKQPINRFVLTSVIVHIMTASAILMLRPTPQPIPEIIEIEIGAGEMAPISSAPILSEQIQEAAPVAEVAPQNLVTTLPEKIVTAPFKSEPIAAPVVAAQIPEPAEATETVEPAASLDDIEKPALAEVAQEEAPTEKQEDLKAELNEKAALAEKAEAEQLALAQKQIQEDIKQKEMELESQAEKAKQKLAEEQKIAAEQAKKKAEAAAALAAANELAAAQEAAAARARAKAEAEALASQSADQGNGQDTQTSAPAEAVGELRSLAQLRQKPGNPRPQYDPQERLQGHNGAVIFKAFVTSDGNLTEFKMLQSTGYKNLDFKTLKALKQWKFYPGQEGWVELPFQWDLKGGPQEMPALLRRRVGQN
jgi:TonB family protein